MNRFFLATAALWKREVLGFARQRSRLLGAIASPLLFWILIGGGLGTSFRDPHSGSGYLQFFFPGMLALSVLFTAIFSTMSVIQDRHAGFLQGVLVSPIPRSAFVAAKILGGATLGLLQGVLLLAFAPLAGFSLSVLSVVEIIGLLFLMGAALTALGFVFAWKIDSVQGYHGVMNMVLMPMWILSGSMFPTEGKPRLMQLLVQLNPLTYAIHSLHAIFGNAAVSMADSQLALAVAVLGAFLAVLFAFSLRLVSGLHR